GHGRIRRAGPFGFRCARCLGSGGAGGCYVRCPTRLVLGRNVLGRSVLGRGLRLQIGCAGVGALSAPSAFFVSGSAAALTPSCIAARETVVTAAAPVASGGSPVASAGSPVTSAGSPVATTGPPVASARAAVAPILSPRGPRRYRDGNFGQLVVVKGADIDLSADIGLDFRQRDDIILAPEADRVA